MNNQQNRRPRPRTKKVYVQDDQSWHFDKRIPIALIFALVAQGAIGLSWANQLTFDVAVLKDDIRELRQESKDRRETLDDIILLKADVKNMVKGMIRLEDLIGRLDRSYERRTEAWQSPRAAMRPTNGAGAERRSVGQ